LSKFRNNKLRIAITLINVIAILLISVCEMYSQERNDSLQADIYIVLADSLINQNNYNLASINYKEAMKLYQNIDWESWYKIFGKYRKAKSKEGKDLFLVKEIPEFIKVIDDNQFLIKGKLLFYLGYYNSKMGLGHEAILAFKKSINEFKEVEGNDPIVSRFLLFSFDNIALNYSRLGDQKSAIKYVNLAINLISHNQEHPKLCDLYLNFSKYLYYDDRFQEVKGKLNQALILCGSNIEKSIVFDYFAEVYINQDSLEMSKMYLDKSIEFESEKDNLFFEIKARYYQKMNLFDQAKVEYKLSLEMYKYASEQRSYIKTLMLYSQLLYKLNEREEALSNSHIALRLYYPDLDSLNSFDRSSINEALPDLWIIEAFNIKAKYFRDKYIETGDEFSLGEATFYYDLLLSHFDKLKSKYYSSSSQYRMGAYSQKIYSEIISFYVDQYREYDKKEDIENAFSLAQRANSFVLRNAVSDREALEMAGVNQDSLEQYLYLASKASSDLKEDTTQGAEVLLEFDNYKESLLSNYPSYGKYDKEEEITIDEIQSSINDNSLVLKYYYFNELLTVFGISKHSTFAENIELPKEIDSLINSNLEILSQSESNDSLIQQYLSNSKTVYDLVLGDLLSKYNYQDFDHLIIVPDGPLKKVAFNALVINENKDWNNPNTYVISKYAVNYLYYCSQLKNENKSYKSKDGFIGFGIEYEDDFLKEIISDYMSNFKDNTSNSRAISLSPLKYADDEVLTTAEILGGTSFINSDVTPSQVYSTIKNFDVIHFSAHAFVDEEDYLNSFVVLNRGVGENYQLKYSDILNLDIDSEMVVLSACQTGSGKSVVGEGLMSLSRAFVQSGSNAAVGAYWNAPDYATKELMTLFYSNLKDGMSKSKAMQQAQIEYLTNDKISSPTIRSPFFWASWAIYGDDQPLRMNSSLLDFTSWKTYLLLAILAFLIFLLFKYFFKKSK